MSSTNTTSNIIDDAVVATRPLPGIAHPSHVSFSPCRRYVSFLRPATSKDLLTRFLYCIDLTSIPSVPSSSTVLSGELVWDPASSAESEESLSLEDKLRRERTRQLSVGITHYAWTSSGTHSRLMIPLNGSIFIKERNTLGNVQDVRKVFDKSTVFFEGGDDAVGGALDPTMSPNGIFVAFVRDSELYVLGIDDPAKAIPTRLTYDSRGQGKTSGLADFIAQEEMDRYHGFWWSPDSQYIAFELVDESHIPEFRILHLGSDQVGVEAQEDHRYPFAGKANPKVKLGVVQVTEAHARPGLRPEVLWLDLNFVPGVEDDDIYLARVDWLPDCSLAVQIENRTQSELLLVRYDISTGVRTLLVHEKCDTWINLHDLFLPFESKLGESTLEKMDTSSNHGFFFIWGSERTGFRHLYLYYFDTSTGTTQLIRQLTSGDWMVTSLVQVQIEKGIIFYTATAESPLERHVFGCRMFPPKGSDVTSTRLTSAPGTNTLIMDSECAMAVWTNASVEHPHVAVLCKVVYDAQGSMGLEVVCKLHDGANSPLVKQQLEGLSQFLRPPELISFNSRDGVLLYSAIYRPDEKRHGPGPYPVIVAVYGGPHVQRVLNTWEATADMRVQRFVNEGYLVLKIDNRGSSGRGLAFEGAIKHKMGTIEVEDQVDGVGLVVNKGLGDPSRVGIYGWSYGGYMSALCLLKKSDCFHVAVSGAPVTSWDGYDTHYTERYMGTPESNPDGYEEGSVMSHVHGLQGKLMLVHGLIDENVHFRHTARLINALIAARKQYDLLLFPNERHSPRRLQDRIYMEKRIKEYFDEHLRDRATRKKKFLK